MCYYYCCYYFYYCCCCCYYYYLFYFIFIIIIIIFITIIFIIIVIIIFMIIIIIVIIIIFNILRDEDFLLQIYFLNLNKLQFVLKCRFLSFLWFVVIADVNNWLIIIYKFINYA